jgi:hypothetical protein
MKLFYLNIIDYFTKNKRKRMTYNFEKSDNTLLMQKLRMQLESYAYAKIRLGEAKYSLLECFEKFWLNECKKREIVPENNFQEEFADFEQHTVMKFAPKKTFENTIKKTEILLHKLGYDISDIEC